MNPKRPHFERKKVTGNPRWEPADDDARARRPGGGSPRPRPASRARPARPRSGRFRLGTIPSVALGLAVLLAFLGLMWRSQLRVRGVTVEGARHTSADTLIALAGVDSGAAFFAIDTEAIAARAALMPWVAEARVHRMPNMTLEIEVRERTPVLLAVDATGRPARYLDREGFQMPFVRGASYGVPILRGYDEPYVPAQATRDSVLIELLRVVADLDAETDALLSTFSLHDGQVELYTAPKPGRGAVHVGLGVGDYAAKLSRLRAFWNQELLAQREKHVEWIDLRFDSQIITRERTLTQ
jgi:cell division septal protein FtsQ